MCIRDSSYIDRNLANNSYQYRLKQIDFDGSTSYSDIITTEIKIEDFFLYQNYPNPFNPITVIKYSLANSCFVNLRLMDVTGREVNVLMNQKQSAGTHELTLDGTNLSSGVYILVLSAVTDKGDNVIL